MTQTKTLQSIADIVEYQLTNFPIWEGQRINRCHRNNGHQLITINADRFYDRIAGNGWTYGISTTITLSDKGVIVNVTDHNDKVLSRLAGILGEMAVSAYKERTAWYFSILKAMPSPVVPEEYRDLNDRYANLISSAII